MERQALWDNATSPHKLMGVLRGRPSTIPSLLAGIDCAFTMWLKSWRRPLPQNVGCLFSDQGSVKMKVQCSRETGVHKREVTPLTRASARGTTPCPHTLNTTATQWYIIKPSLRRQLFEYYWGFPLLSSSAVHSILSRKLFGACVELHTTPGAIRDSSPAYTTMLQISQRRTIC